jgi:hypothetical protein
MQQNRQIIARIPLGPRGRAIAVFVIVTLLILGLEATAGEIGPLAVLVAVWAGFFGVYVLYRMAFFAERVPLLLPGTSLPYFKRMRRTVGRRRNVPQVEPVFLSAGEANSSETEVQPEDRVIGIEVGGHAIAYPLAAMSVREVAHEVLDGKHLFISWWPVTYSARAFVYRSPGVQSARAAEPELIPLRKTLLNSTVLMDGSGSEIVQFLGQAVVGPLTGLTLDQVPVVSTNWRAWSTAFPDTEVMSLDGTPDVDIFERYYVRSRPGLYPQPSRDRRWLDKDTVLGVEVNGEARCYPYPALIERPIINDELGREPVLIAHERLSATAVAFSRVVDGRTLTFSGGSKNSMRPQAEPDEIDIRRRINYEPWFLVDEQTGSRWRAVNGECVSGELEGKRLHMLPGQTGFWFAWSRFYPNADVLEPRPKSGDEGR